MKHLFYPFLSVLLIGCSSLGEDPIEEESGKFAEETIDDPSYKISLGEAIDLASSAIDESSRGSSSAFQISYILASNASRSMSGDTIAYVLNRNEGGFAVVAADSRMSALLAYSDEGAFQYEESSDDPVYACFVSRLPAYYRACVDGPIIPDNQSDTIVIPVNPPSGVIIPGKVKVKWHQGTPYNNYVVVDYPGCPVGCVALATGEIATHCKPSLSNYHGYTYNFTRMLNVLNRTVINPTYSEDDALDDLARLLYDIGKDEHMRYRTGGSGTFSYYAYQWFINNGYEVFESGLTSYNAGMIANLITDGYLVYMDGPEYNVYDGSTGHAWVVDGCKYKFMQLASGQSQIVDSSGYHQRAIYDILLRCVWGWNNVTNGFFSGDVFDINGYEFRNMEYFSVKIDN